MTNFQVGDRVIEWPDCIVPGCPNKCCLRLRSDKCYPHTMLGDSSDPDFFNRLAKLPPDSDSIEEREKQEVEA